jgi:hypothetical protein
MRPVLIAFLFIASLASSSYSQVIGEMQADEDKFLARTKQVNQFFRRFNGEEDVEGNRLYEGDREFRSVRLRREYLKILFDEQSKSISPDLMKEFMSFVSDKKDPHFLEFHGHDWTAQVDVEFQYEGKTQNGIIFMKLEQAGLGYKWVIDNVYFKPFEEFFLTDTAYTKKFLHPMSHEIEFMNLRKIFEDKDSLQQYFIRGYKPDQMSLFLYEAGKGNLKFITVRDVKFHFFQIPGWYFELSFVNRGGYNSGWMITNLVRYKPGEEAMLRAYIYYER